MLLNYLKIAARTLLKKKVYTIVTILGLSVGAATSLMIFLFVADELSYDKFLPESDRIYRVVEDRIYPDRVAYFAMIPGGFSTILPEDVPEVEQSTRLVGFPNFSQVYRYKDKIFSEQYFFAADSNFFQVFPYKLLKGNPAAVLRDPQTIVLTESTAKKYFGDEDPIGKMIQAGDQNIEVVGVMQDLPENTHMKFDALAPSRTIGFLEQPNFYIAGTYTYVKLAKGSDPSAVEKKIPALVEKYAAGQIERDLGVSYQKYIKDGNGYIYTLQPLHDIHLTSQRVNEIKPNANSVVVNTFIFISILILVIAGINFVNLATARSAERAREVGVRKVLGSRKKQLIYQFLSESVLISAISIIVAIVLIQLSIDFFSTLSGKKLSMNLFTDPMSIAMVIATALGLGIFGGLYPAFYISALRPVQILKGKFQSSSQGRMLRNGLVVLQFTISAILISATMIVYDQLEFVSSKGLGFEKENVVVINHNGNGDDYVAMAEEFKKVPGVLEVGAASAVPGGYFYGIQFRTPGATEIFTPKGFTMDDNFGSAMKLKLVDGRLFSPEFDDSLSVVINQRAAKALNLENPVGATLMNNPTPDVTLSYTIVGVVEDFNFESLHSEIAPLVIMSNEGQLAFHNVLVARIEGENIRQSLASIEQSWKTLVPNDPFIFSFMDGRLDALYASEKSSGYLLTVFSVIAIIIACVGLFGLAAYTANQRVKEIGVRKVLGASVFSIVNLLSQDFAKLVVIAFVLAVPATVYLMNEWLSIFAYRTSVTWTTFALAGGVVMLFTLLTISYQAIGAAIANPVKSLRDE